MKSSRSKGTQQQQQRSAAPLFPRVHISETRNGPKAPPRNKMALYEQLTIPSHHCVHRPSLHQAYHPQQRNLDEIPSSSNTKHNSRLKESSQKRGRNEDVLISARQLKSGKHGEPGDTNLSKNLLEAQNNNAFNASVVDSAGKLVPADVIAAIGEADFWRIRKTLIRQQRILADHVFELHRLVQVQHMLAESAILLLEPESKVPRLLPPQSTPPEKTSSKPPVSKPVNVHSTATRSSNQNQQHCAPTYGLPVSSSSLQYPGILSSSWRYAAASGGNQLTCQPYMFHPVYNTGSGPSYQPVFGSHFAPGLPFYYHQNQQQQQQHQQQWPPPWYPSYSPQLQLSTSANSMAVSSPNGCADVQFQQQQQPQQQQEPQQQQQQQEVKESGCASTSGLTSDRTSSKEQQPQQQQNPRTSLTEDSRARNSAFSHVRPTKRITNQRAWATRAVMATPESAAGILKSIQREQHSSKTS